MRNREPFSRRVYGFIESADIVPEGARNTRLINFVLDTVRADRFDDGSAQQRSLSNLAFVRVLTTERRLREFAGESTAIREGTWLELQLKHCPGNPRAWVSDADAPYGNQVRTNVVSVRPISKDSARSSALYAQLNAWCGREAEGECLHSVVNQEAFPTSVHVRVVDVGQAGYCALHRDQNEASPIIGYFDVGVPIPFNHRTLIRPFSECGRVPSDGFVVVSHWDFDHYGAAVTECPDLQRLRWYAPATTRGPRAARLVKNLGRRLTLLHNPTISFATGCTLLRGCGAPSDLNASGYVMCIDGPSSSVILTGDVPYQALPEKALANLTGIVIPHHGSACFASPPTPSGIHAVAIASYGSGNCYKHPCERFLGKHVAGGWSLMRTAVTTGTGRGDRWLS